MFKTAELQKGFAPLVIIFLIILLIAGIFFVSKNQKVLYKSGASTLICSSIGDSNQDGQVDFTDYNAWYKHLQMLTINGALDGDFNCDGIANVYDYNIWYVNRTIQPTSTPSPNRICNSNGDANLDGKTDIYDYNIWLTHNGQFSYRGVLDADFNCDSITDFADYTTWNLHYVTPSPTPTTKPSPTPTRRPTPTPTPYCYTTCSLVKECRQASNCSGTKLSPCGTDIYNKTKYICSYNKCTSVCK